MLLQALLPRTDVDQLLSDLLPLRVLLGKDASDRTLLLRDPSAVAFVAGHGIALSCKADVRWSLLGVGVPIYLRALTVMLVPRITERASLPALVFDVAIEHADLAGVPAVVDSRLVGWVNQALEQHQVELSWSFGKTLSHQFALPAMLDSLRSFDLAVGRSQVDVLQDALRLELEVQAGVTRAE
jgi:hypothetical protein